MIEIFGYWYNWTPELLKKEITDRLLAGDELTICYKEKTAWVNKWHKNPVQINFELSKVIVALGIVGEDSGNLDTGEVHYNFNNR